MSDLANLIEAVKQGDLESVRAILDTNGEIVNQRDESGATPIHYATLNGRRQIVRLLLERGAEINIADSQFGATPTGWAIEYLREMGGYLAIELKDLAYAIQLGDVRWVARFMERFPALRQASDKNGKPFQQLARESGNREIARLFGSEDAEADRGSDRGERNGFRTSVTATLSVRNWAHAIDFYRAAFGASELYRVEGGGVAQLSVSGAVFWVAEESPQHLNFSPESLSGCSVRMLLIVEDPKAVCAQAVAAGATEVAPVVDDYGWRLGRIVDPFGHHWEIGRPLS
jgi:PhnB protein